MSARKLVLLDDMGVSSETKKTYNSILNIFFRWSGIKGQRELLRMGDEKLQDLMEGYVDHLRKRVEDDEISPNSVPNLFKPFRILLDVNYREHAIKWKPISARYPPMEKKSGYRPWTTEQVATFLQYAKTARAKAGIHFQASTGCRIGVHDHPLLMRHMVRMGEDCYAVLIYAEADEDVAEKDQRILNAGPDGGDYSFFVFLTPEASAALDEYHAFREKGGEHLGPDSPIFASLSGTPGQRQMTGAAFRQMFEKILARTPVRRNKKRNRYDTMIEHAFRKRFNTVLKINGDVNSNIAEKLMQHKRGLDGSYLVPTRDECFAEFSKAIPDLTVDSTERQKVEIADQNARLDEYKKQEVRIRDLEEENKGLKRDMESSMEERMGQARHEMEEKASEDAKAVSDRLERTNDTVEELKAIIKGMLDKDGGGRR